MKKIYFAGKFNKKEDENLSLFEQLKDDYRSKLLKSPVYLTKPHPNLKITENTIYSGPFYCEEASNGDFTSTDCDAIIKAEYKAIKQADILVVVFDTCFSVGSIVELSWGLDLNKEIIILYKEEKGAYQIKSEYWFAILNAKLKNPKTLVFSFKNNTELEAHLSNII
ncbi:MAG: hypothetical protein IKW39_05980 [Alphaproteobacteria bacterium]|nr:hypothetical protein [Alphaproteobacteria bacterium]